VDIVLQFQDEGCGVMYMTLESDPDECLCHKCNFIVHVAGLMEMESNS